jgi:thymidylate synthase
MTPGKLHISIGDAHLYLNHIDAVHEQLAREPKPAPRLFVNPDVARKDWSEITLADFTLEGYDPCPAIRAPMAV